MTKETIQQKIEQEAEKQPELLGWLNDGTAEGNDIKRAFKAGATFVLETILPEILKKEKENLIWKMITDWQDARDIGEDIEAAKFSFNEIEITLYDYLDKNSTPLPSKVKH